MIYLILSAGFKEENPDILEKRLKIGYAKDIKERLDTYYVTNPDVILLDTREGDTKLEHYLHKKFEKYKYPKRNEWFYYDEEIIKHFQDELEDIIDKDILLECIKTELRSKIPSISELKDKYLDQILNEIRSRDDFNEELYDEEAFIKVIVKVWERGIKQFNDSINNIEFINNNSINLFNCPNDIEVTIKADLPQILGRQRLFDNPWKNQATFYYKLTCDFRKVTKEQFDASLNIKRSRTGNLLSVYEKGTDTERRDLAGKYLKSAKSDNYKDDYVAVNTHGGTCLKPVFNNLVYVSELRAFDIQQVDYKDRFSVFSSINLEFDACDVINLELQRFFSEFDNLGTLYEKLKLFCNFDFSDENIFNIALNQVDEKIRSYFYGLGKDGIKALGYNQTKIDKALGIRLFDEANLGNHIRTEFKPGEKYTLSDLKQKLGELYERIGYEATPKANDILNYFEVKEYMITQTIKEEKKRVRCYELLNYKF